MTIAAHIYCTSDDIRDILSDAGVSLATDDYPPSEYGNAISKAGNKIDLYLARRYSPESLAQSDLVKDWAAAIASYFLRVRRGNPAPPGIVELYDEAIAEMTDIKLGRNDLPGVAARKSYAPGMSKMRPTMRPYPRAVVETSQGTHAGGDPSGYRQHRDPWDAYGFNADAFLNWSL